MGEVTPGRAEDRPHGGDLWLSLDSGRRSRHGGSSRSASIASFGVASNPLNRSDSMNRVFGLALFVVGVVLLVMGFSASDSIGSDFSRFFTGKPTDKAIWLMLGGIASIVVGAGSLMVGR